MIKRKLLAVAVTGALSSSAMASTFHNAGSILGYGDAGNTHTLFNNFQNPASLGGDTSKRLWGLGASGSIEIEYTGMTQPSIFIIRLPMKVAHYEKMRSTSNCKPKA